MASSYSLILKPINSTLYSFVGIIGIRHPMVSQNLFYEQAYSLVCFLEDKLPI